MHALFWILIIILWLAIWLTGGVWTAGYIENLVKEETQDTIAFCKGWGGFLWGIVLPIILIYQKMKIVFAAGHRRSEQYVAMDKRRIANEEKIRVATERMRKELDEEEEKLDVQLSNRTL